MNQKIGKTSAIIVTFAVVCFALCMPFGFLFGDYLSSMLIAFGFVPLMCAFAANGKPESKAAGTASCVFAGMYAVIILLVYFTQVTTVRLETLNPQATALIDYTKFGLYFNYDLLGYCLMALSTFMIGFTIDVRTKSDKALQRLLWIHGVFAIGCFLMPMLGVFNANTTDAEWIGTLLLEFWCVYFIPVGVLSYLHFNR